MKCGLYFLAKISVIAVLLLCIGGQGVGGQNNVVEPLKLVQVLRALASKKADLGKKNNLLIAGVKERGVDFPLTTEIESELRRAGASDELIQAIAAVAAKPVPTPNLIAEQLSREQAARAQAEQQAAIERDEREATQERLRAAEERIAIETARRRGEIVWQIAALQNDTERAVGFRVYDGRKWSHYRLAPGRQTVFQLNAELLVEFNLFRRAGGGFDRNQRRLCSNLIIGRPPTREESFRGRINRFAVDDEGALTLLCDD